MRTGFENMYPNLSAQVESVNGRGNQRMGTFVPWNRLTGGSSALTALATSAGGGGSGRGISFVTSRFRARVSSASRWAGMRAGVLNADVLGDGVSRLRTAVSRTRFTVATFAFGF